MSKVCPLSFIGCKDGKTLVCPGENCMFWDARFEPQGCVLLAYFGWNVFLMYKENQASDDLNNFVGKKGKDSISYG